MSSRALSSGLARPDAIAKVGRGIEASDIRIWGKQENTTWRLTASVLTLKQEGNALTGEMSGPAGTAPIENDKVEGDTLSWHAKVTSPMPITLEFTGKTEGDNLSGSVKLGAFGTSTFSGTAA